MSAADRMAAQAAAAAAPYPAALTIPLTRWRSPLGRDGHIPLARPVIQIGRMEGNDIVLDDPLVSRYHAVIRWCASGYELADLGAVNGTYVDGQRVLSRVFLAPGQVIRAGSTELVFHVSAGLDAQAGALAATSDPSAFASSAPALPGSSLTSMQLPVVSPSGALGTTGGDEAVWPTAQPMSSVPPPGPAIPTSHPYLEALARPPERGLARLLRTEGRKRYWRVFLLGMLAYIAVSQVLAHTGNLHLVPLQMLLASALVPVVFVIFCWEQNAFADMPPAVVGVTFMSGAILGLTISALLEPLLLPLAGHGTIGLTSALLIGLCEETAKVVSVAWFLRDRRIRSELDGLILGAAAGMGFAALETAGYGFVAFITGFGDAASAPGATLALAVNGGIRQMNVQLLLRMGLAIFGHGVWTAIVCAAIWRERGNSAFRLTVGVVAAFATAVGLHALWDWSPLTSLLPAQTNSSTVLLVSLVLQVGWFAVVGAVGLLLLRFFLRESLRRAKLGPLAPPPAPLFRALLADVLGAADVQTWAAYDVSAVQALRHPSGASPVGRQAVAHCGRCGVSYPPGTPACERCGGPLSPLF